MLLKFFKLTLAECIGAINASLALVGEKKHGP